MRTTNHGRERILERVRFRGTTVNKLVRIAFKEGLQSSDLSQYLDEIANKYGNCTPKIYMYKTYIFNKQGGLITVYPLKSHLLVSYGRAVASK